MDVELSVYKLLNIIDWNDYDEIEDESEPPYKVHLSESVSLAIGSWFPSMPLSIIVAHTPPVALHHCHLQEHLTGLCLPSCEFE